RDQHAMAYDSTRGRVVLFGGSTGTSETWEWDGTSWTPRFIITISPSPRIGHAMAFDSVSGRVVLFGGIGSSTFDDTWEWDGHEWSLRATTDPAPRAFHAMAFDSARLRIVLLGGWNGTLLPDTWEYGHRLLLGPPLTELLGAFIGDATLEAIDQA